MSENVIQIFRQTARTRADTAALKSPQGDGWQTMTWRDYERDVMLAARGFMALGLERGRAVSIIGFNRAEWLIADLAAIAAGGMPAGIYTTSSAELCAYVAGHCRAQVVVVENAEHLAKFQRVRDQLPELKAIVMMDGSDPAEDVHTWEELLAVGDQTDNAEDLEARIAAQTRDDAATLIYTSGTTGNPKAVQLSHHNLIWTASTVARKVDARAGDDQISYLPLSHIAEQMFSIHGPITFGGTIWFAPSLEELGATLAAVRPQTFFAVPRVWEKIQHRMQAAGAEASPVQKKIVAWAKSVGLKAAAAEENGGSRPLLYPLAEKLVFSKVKQRLGLDRTRFRGTGAAPISRETLDFFAGLDLMLYEVWGQSETTGAGTLNVPGQVKRGAIGKPYPETEIRIADDGEILMRGPSVFMGYLDNEEATRDTLDADGWLHTGDVGHIDDDGFVHITDRKKELIITAGGENISPAHVEGELKTIGVVSQCCVIGDRRKYLSALITLDEESLPEAAAAAGSPAKTPAEAAECDRFRAWFDQQLAAVNARLARVQTIKHYRLLAEDFTIDGGELTPTMKLKRRVVYDKYADQIEALYAD
ncbi:AMP-dependent synthetase/ligase [Spectribacter hydrogenooxidans]|uniref:AMP-binding protein n=1 Tax=Spectribacter hydrogenoxidans TaxID=3075608 RepID=A0ABU3C3U9_9GAMM|nr:AMP-binding protein [Salinisphaera sp. W335]MDT0636233.1 AMP-binding protein [Salinisphaera sp. W335]